jgi:hypothetical protein
MNSLFVIKCGKQMTSSTNRHKYISEAAVLLDMVVGEQGCSGAHFKISTFCVRTLKHIHYQSLRCLRLRGIGGQSLEQSWGPNYTEQTCISSPFILSLPKVYATPYYYTYCITRVIPDLAVIQ